MTPMNPSQPTGPEPGGTGPGSGEQGTSPGTARAWGSEPPQKEPAQPGSDETPEDAAPAPEGVGESTTRRGEDVIKEEGKEAGRKSTGTDAGPVERPTGESTPRDATGIQPPEDPDSAAPQSP
ncbi:hypothetical protein J7E83_17400 [Arthrobacter sp. ISL-48]|uniref:hypothetical protein n=1 Tax=Arthrobacter sp. ISL-48 TaxID=2819110 RepID=UPI001BE600DB|nr:hypothetical protein [Arthrobacter sp. ISL-48]MBT2533868.1 hypothetical protein [Arthrobacter sp. ISL-48]